MQGFKNVTLVALIGPLLLLSTQTAALAGPPPDIPRCALNIGPKPDSRGAEGIPVEDGMSKTWYSALDDIGVSIKVAFTTPSEIMVSNLRPGPPKKFAILLYYGTAWWAYDWVLLQSGAACTLQGARVPREVSVQRMQ